MLLLTPLFCIIVVVAATGAVVFGDGPIVAMLLLRFNTVVAFATLLLHLQHCCCICNAAGAFAMLLCLQCCSVCNTVAFATLLRLQRCCCVCNAAVAFAMLLVHLQRCWCVCNAAGAFAMLLVHLQHCWCICNAAGALLCWLLLHCDTGFCCIATLAVATLAFVALQRRLLLRCGAVVVAS